MYLAGYPLISANSFIISLQETDLLKSMNIQDINYRVLPTYYDFACHT